MSEHTLVQAMTQRHSWKMLLPGLLLSVQVLRTKQQGCRSLGARRNNHTGLASDNYTAGSQMQDSWHISYGTNSKLGLTSTASLSSKDLFWCMLAEDLASTNPGLSTDKNWKTFIIIFLTSRMSPQSTSHLLISFVFKSRSYKKAFIQEFAGFLASPK